MTPQDQPIRHPLPSPVLTLEQPSVTRRRRRQEETRTPRHAAKSGAGRLLALDAARGVALAGMVIINVGPVKVSGLLDRLYLAPYGRASILFVLVAGISMTFFLRSRRRDARRWPTLLWRSGLFLFGGLLMQSLTPQVSVILPMYGVLFVLALALQHLPRQALLGLAVAMAVLGPAVIVMHETLDGHGQHFTAAPTIAAPIRGIAHSVLLSGPYPVAAWVVPFLIGMWVAGLDLSSRVTLNAMIAWGALLATTGLAGAVVGPALAGRTDGYAKLLTGAAHGQMPLWLVSSIGGAVCAVAAFLRYWHLVGRYCGPLVAAGQMALSLYVIHFLVIAVTTRADTRAVGIVMSAALITALLTFAHVWLRLSDIGPLERVIRASWLRRVSGPPRRARA